MRFVSRFNWKNRRGIENGYGDLRSQSRRGWSPAPSRAHMKHRQFQVQFIGLILAMMVVSNISSCSRKEDSTTVDSKESFQLAIIRGEKNCTSPKLGDSWETVWPVLQTFYPSNAIHTVNLAGIESYNWTEQSITLSDMESETFSSIISNQTGMAEICQYAFLVLLNYEPIYGGKITFSQSALARKYPVIYIELDNNKLELLIRPFHSVLPIDSNDPAWPMIRDPRVKNVFLKANKLIE